MRAPITAVLAVALLLPGCMTTTTTTRTWGAPPADAWARTGRVQSIRETVQRTRGDPAGGAVAGAAVGGVLGALLGGHGHHGYFHPSGPGAVFGAATGAMVGAVASQGGSEQRTYEVVVVFDDGGYQTFVYGWWPPFRVGDPVQWTAQGLAPV